MSTPSTSIWVFHQGALGDSVLLWPFLRAAQARGYDVTFVTDSSKARLAATELGITGFDAEQDRFNALWRTDPQISPIPGVSRVLSFNAGNDSSGHTWFANATGIFPGAAIERRTQRPDRLVVADLVRHAGGEAPVALRHNPQGPTVVHVGAGSPDKRWPLRRFAGLVERLNAAGLTTNVLAGEAELDRFDPRERTLFESLAGRFLQTLDELASLTRAARLFIGCDSGPTHLAAQLGVPTLALFGPTRAEIWGPAGPQVRILADHGPSAITWLHPAPVFDAAMKHLRECGLAPP